MIGLFVLSQQEGVNDTPFFGADASSNPQQITINAYTYNASRMGSAPTITATIWNENCLDDYWSNSVYISFKGEKYFLSQIPTSSYSNTEVMYKHEAIFVSERVVLENVYFYDVVTNDTENDKPASNNSEFSFFGDIHQFAQRLGYSLNYAGLDYTVVVDDGISSEEKLVTFEHKFFSEVLQEAYKTYDVPYYFVGKEIHIGYTDNAIEDVFRYGANDALLSITKANANQRVINRATGLGSEHNLPYYYPNLTPKGNVIAEADDSVNIAESDLSITNPLLFAEKVEVGKPITYVANNGDISEKTRFIQTFSSYAANENRYAKEITKRFDTSYSSWTDKVCKIEGDIYNKCEEKITNANGRLFRFIPKFEIVRRFWTTDYHADVDINNVPDVEVTAKPFLTVMGYDESGKKILDERIQSDGIIEYIVPDNCASVWWKSVVSYRVFGYDQSSVDLSMDYTVESTPYWTYDNKKIELSDIGLAVQVEPFDGDSIYQRYGDYIKPQQMLMPPIYRESEGAERFYNAINDTYQNPEEDEGVKYDFENPYVEGNPKEQIVQFEEIFPTIKDVKNSEGLRIDMFSEFAYDQNDNDETELDEDGNEQYIHPYFFGKLRKLDFNLFDCALDSGEMKVSMTSGNCGACEFIIGVDKDSRKNTVQVGNNGELLFDENGNVRCGREIYQDEEEPQPQQQDTINNEVWVALKKDNSTFGVLMPNATNNYRPTACSTPTSNDGDTFVLLNISLPQHYIEVAEQKLEEQVIRFMYDNNVEKFNFSAKFSRIYFQEHPTLLALLDENSRINLEYNGKTHLLYVSSYSYKVDEDNILPEITVELKDTISVSQNAIQKAMNVVAQELNRTLGEFDVIAQTTGKFLRKDRPDTALQPITFEEKVTLNKGAIVEKSIQSKGYYQGRQGMSIYQDENGDWHIESDFFSARKKLTAHAVEIQRAYHISGAQIKSAASMICSNVEDTGDGYRCYFETTNDEGITITNDFMVNDLAFAQTFNLVADANGDMSNQFYWRKVMEVGENYILLSKQDAASGSTEPMIGDHIVQLGNTTDTTRQSAVVDAGAGVDAPYYRQYVGINTFELPDPETQLKPNDNILSGKVFFKEGSSGLKNVNEWNEFVSDSRKGQNLVTGTRKSVVIPENYSDDFDWAIFPPEWKLSRPLEKGKTYTLTCQSTGEWTPNHIPNEESNGVTLRVVNGVDYAPVISDSNTGTTGTTFVWNQDWNPELQQSIRLNSYAISQRFWNLKIEEGNVATPWSPAPSEQPTTYTNKSDDAPYSPKVGDMWIPSDTPHITKTYTTNGWQISGDSTGTTINGGLITSGTIQLGSPNYTAKAGITGEGTSNSSVRIWAGSGAANMDNAPFRVMQDGTIFANKGIFGGLIRKSPTHISIDNIAEYATGTDGNYVIDLTKTGSFIVIDSWSSDPDGGDVQLYLPTIIPYSDSIGVVSSEEDKDYLRGLINETIIVKNEDPTNFVYVCNGYVCTQVHENGVTYFTLKASAVDDEIHEEVNLEQLTWDSLVLNRQQE